MQFIREIPGFCSHFREEIIARHTSCIDKLRRQSSTLCLACKEILTSAVFFKAGDRSYVPKDKQGRLYYIDKTPEEFMHCKVTILDPIGVSSNAPLEYTLQHLIEKHMDWQAIKDNSGTHEGENDYRVGLSNCSESLRPNELVRAIIDHFYSEDSKADFRAKLKLNASDEPQESFPGFTSSRIEIVDSVEYDDNEALMQEEDIRQAEVHIFHLMRDKPTYFSDDSDDEDDDVHDEEEAHFWDASYDFHHAGACDDEEFVTEETPRAEVKNVPPPAGTKVVKRKKKEKERDKERESKKRKLCALRKSLKKSNKRKLKLRKLYNLSTDTERKK